jgi:hypothetical protein
LQRRKRTDIKMERGAGRAERWKTCRGQGNRRAGGTGKMRLRKRETTQNEPG